MSKDIYKNMNLSDNSYLLDSDLFEKEISSGRSKENIILLTDLHEFEHHPFNVITDSDDFAELVDSIKVNGVIYPILVRPQGAKYEIISGHRRVAACKAAGLTEIPAIIRPMDDYEATVLMVHTNLYRSEISIMERSRAYRMCHDAEVHQGKRIGGDTAARLGSEASDSRRKVYRYIRLSYLNDFLLGFVSERKITINVGIELSYLDEESQTILQEVMEEYSFIPNNDQAALLGELGRKKESVSKEKILSMILGSEKRKSAKNSITLKIKDIDSFFEPETAPERMSEIIVHLLQRYKEGALSEHID